MLEYHGDAILDYHADLPGLDLDAGQAKRVLSQFQAGAWHSIDWCIPRHLGA
jgi:hypothetical protein